MVNNVLPPYPQYSKISDKTGTVLFDWLNWFSTLQIHVSKLLNRYDSNKSGLAILVAGTVTIANISVNANSKLRMTAQNVSGTAGFLSVAFTVGVGFTITSSSGTDTRTILYEIVEAF